MILFAVPVNPYDAGISASAGTFMAHGLVPWRDFWLLYGPLSGIVLGVALLFLPPTVGTLRMFGALTIAVQAVAGYALVRGQTTRFAAGLIAVLAALLPSVVVGPDLHAWPMAMGLALSALAVAAGGSTRAAVLAGVLAGLSTLSRQDVGVYVLIAMLLVSRKPSTMLGWLVVIVPAAAVAIFLVPVPALIEQLIWYPLVGPREYRSLPLAVTPEGPVHLAVVVLVGWIPRAAIIVTGCLLILRRRAGLGGLVVFASLCQLQTLGRADVAHMAQAAGPALLLTAAWFPPLPSRRWVWSSGLGVLVAGYASLVMSAAAWLTVPAGSYEEDLGDAVRRIRATTEAGETIFVGLTRHAFTYSNPLLAYYLADRPPGTSMTMFNPGVTNTEEQQLRMIRELNRRGTRVALLDRRFADHCEPQNRSCEPGPTILDDFLTAFFTEREDVGEFVVARRVMPP